MLQPKYKKTLELHLKPNSGAIARPWSLKRRALRGGAKGGGYGWGGRLATPLWCLWLGKIIAALSKVVNQYLSFTFLCCNLHVDMVAVDSVDVLFHRLVAFCLAENNWSTIQFSSTCSHCFVLVPMSLHPPLMWKQKLYLFLIFCVCMFVLVWTWKCEHTPEKVNGGETGWARDCEKVSTDLWERIVSSSEIGENLSSSILHTLICQHIPTLKSTSSLSAEHISLLLLHPAYLQTVWKRVFEMLSQR